MTTPEQPEKRTETIQLRLSPAEVAPFKGRVTKDSNLSDVVRKVLADNVVHTRAARKTAFEAELAGGQLVEIGRFDNEFGETYVLYRFNRGPVMIGNTLVPVHVYVTGDELDWEQGATYENGKLGQMFMISPEERKEIDRLLGASSDPTRQGVEVGEKIKREVLAETGQPKAGTKMERAAHGVMYWRGGSAAAEAGYPYGHADHQAFFMGFMEGLA